jgi:hypothetical protein
LATRQAAHPQRNVRRFPSDGDCAAFISLTGGRLGVGSSGLVLVIIELNAEVGANPRRNSSMRHRQFDRGSDQSTHDSRPLSLQTVGIAVAQVPGVRSSWVGAYPPRPFRRYSRTAEGPGTGATPSSGGESQAEGKDRPVAPSRPGMKRIRREYDF